MAGESLAVLTDWSVDFGLVLQLVLDHFVFIVVASTQNSKGGLQQRAKDWCVLQRQAIQRVAPLVEGATVENVVKEE